MEYTTRVGKILTSQKLPDRYLSTKIYYPKNPKEESFGTLFILVEILNPWFPSAEVANAICETIIEAYYHSEHQFLDNVARFEEALKKVNQRLADFASKGVNSWVGNLNCTILTIQNEELYISHSGNTQLYLFREQTLSEVCEDLSGRQNPPLSTFLSVTTGNLEKGDKLLLTNQKLLDVMPLQSLREVISFTGPISAIHQLSKILRRNRIRDVNSLVFELIEKDDRIPPTEAELEGEDTIYIDQAPAGTWEKLFSGVKPTISKNIESTSEQSERFWNRFLLKSQEHLNKTPHYIKKAATTLGFHTLSAYHSIRGRKVQKVQKAQSQISQERNYLKPKFDIRREKRPVLSVVGNAVPSFFRWIGSLFLLKNRRTLYGILIVIFIIILGLSFYRTFSGNSGNIRNSDVEKIISQANTKIKQAKDLESQNQKSKARELLTNTFDALEKVQSNPKYGEKVQNLLFSTAAEIDKVDNTRRLLSKDDVGVLVSGIATNFISAINSKVYFLSKNQLENYDLIRETKGTNIDIPEAITSPQFQSEYTDSEIAFYAKDQNIYFYDSTYKSFKKANLTSGEEWASAVSIAEYARNLYLLESDGTVQRYTSVALGFSRPRQATDIAGNQIKAKSLAIDGNIFELTQDGKIYKFFRGDIVDDYQVKISDSGSKLKNPKKIFTNENINNIYVSDSIIDFDGSKVSRILQFTKDGDYLSQYKFSSKLGSIKDFTFDSRAKELIVLTTKSLLAIKP